MMNFVSAIPSRVTAIATLTAFLFLLPPATKAEPLPEDGFFGRVGIGFSPYARTVESSLGFRAIESGIAPAVILGVIWEREHAFELRWQNVSYLGEAKGSQGTIGITYTRHLQLSGPSPFFTVGLGLQWGPFRGVQSGKLETDNGAAFLFGAGVRVSHRWIVEVNYSFGSTNRFLDIDENFEYKHRQLVFSLQYTIFGG